MTAARNSAEAHAAHLRASVRRGVWRRVLAWLGLGGAKVRRVDAQAALWAHGARAEAATAALLDPLRAEGWRVWHDMMVPGWRFNLDHILLPPTGDALVVLDTKGWRRTWETRLHGERVQCGPEDRHEQVEKAAQHARTVAAALGLAEGLVVPMLAIHGSPVLGGRLFAPTPYGAVHVLAAPMLLPALRAATAQGRDAVGVARLGRLVKNRLRPYPHAS